MKIVLDPGHSGPFEPGACAGGFTEAEIVLSIARRTCRRLLAAGHAVRLTRSGNIADADLAWRSDLANRWGADLFISIHANSAENPSAHGSEIWRYPGSAAGASLGRSLLRCITERLQTADRGVKEADLQVLRETDCPAALVETAFISNPQDRLLLIRPSTQEDFAVAVAAGVAAYCASPAVQASCTQWALF